MKKRTNEASFIKYNLDAASPIVSYQFAQEDYKNNYSQYHNCFEVGICLEGMGNFCIGNKVLPFFGGNIVVILPGDVHIAQSTGEKPSVWFYLFFDAKMLGLTELPKYSTLFYNKGCYHIMNAILYEHMHKGTDYIKRITFAVQMLFSSINNLTVDIFQPSNKDMRNISAAINYIINNFCEDIEKNMLAKMCGFSVGHFRREFRRIMNMTPTEYITLFRMTAAESMLRRTDKAVLEIAYDVGFNTVSAFNKAFRLKNGISPREFRNNYKLK